MNVEHIEATPAVEPADARVSHPTSGIHLVVAVLTAFARKRHSTQMAQDSKSRGYTSHNRTVAHIRDPAHDR